MFRHSLIVLCSGLCGLALAEEIPQHRLRVLAVGDPPPFVQEIRNGARYEVAPPVGTIPPRTVTIPLATKSGESPVVTPPTLRLRLGQPSPSVSLPMPESGKVELQSEKGAKWLNVPLQPCGASLALVWRGSRDWKDARTIVIPDDDASHAEGNVHFANLTAASMAIVFGTEKIRLDPGKTFSRKVNGAAVPLEILYPTATGELKLCHSASLEPSHGTFRRIVIYAADGEKPRRPVKVLQLEEASQSIAPATVAVASH